MFKAGLLKGADGLFLFKYIKIKEILRRGVGLMIGKIAMKTKKGDLFFMRSTKHSFSLSLTKIVFIFICFLYILLYICKLQLGTNFPIFHA